MLFSFFTAYFGFAALSLSKNRHYQQVWPERKLSDASAQILTSFGWVLLVFSSFPVFFAEKFSIAFTQYFGVLSLASFFLIVQFAYLPRSVAAITWIDHAIKLINRRAATEK